MIRFSPDSFLEAMLRPILMALPQGWVYTEIVAPDFRFLLLLLVVFAAIAAMVIKRRAAMLPRGLMVSLLLLIPAFTIWLLSGGNGRYFMPFLLLVGPMLAAAIYHAPFTQNMRRVLLLVCAVLQAMAISVNPPWGPFDSLEWGRWRTTHYFDVDVEAANDAPNATYVTFAGQSLSLIAPLFPASVHWINLNWFDGHDFTASKEQVVAVARARLKEASDLRVMLQAQPRKSLGGEGLPDDEALASINNYVSPFGLRLTKARPCRLIRSGSLAARVVATTSDKAEAMAHLRAVAGFWSCPAEYVGRPSHDDAVDPAEARARRVFSRLEAKCPRLFPPGQYALKKNGYGFTRPYSASDSSLTFALADATVYAKFVRALNPQRVASEAEILAPDFKLNCDGFVSREGLPWLRTI
jgi:hypothetical protein